MMAYIQLLTYLLLIAAIVLPICAILEWLFPDV